MKRSPMPDRTEPLARSGPLRRTSSLDTTVSGKPRRQRDTGPTPKVRKLVHKRSGDRCEWPGCPLPRRDVQHRLGRKNGGRHGEMSHRLNQAAWLLDICRPHHNYVTSAAGLELDQVRDTGWVLREGQDAREVPVLTRHAGRPVVLDNAGGWRQVD